MTLETSINLMDFLLFCVSLFGVTATIIFILILIKEISQSRIQSLYTNLLKLEGKITDDTKDLWGIPEDNIITPDGEEIKINLNKLSYFVCFLDSYACHRAQKSRRFRPKKYSKDSLIYKALTQKVYRQYWEHIVKPRFYYTGGFADAIDATIEEIENN